MSSPRATPLPIESLEPRTLLAAGDLDPAFGTGGFVSGTGAPVEKVLSSPAGVYVLTRTEPGTLAQIDVIRVLPNGQPDPAFGVNGEAVFGDPLSEDIPIDFAIAPDGSILVLSATVGQRNSQQATRLTPAGALDPAFGAGGVVTFSPSVPFTAIAPGPTGSFIVGGVQPLQPPQLTITRFFPDGTTDPGFGAIGSVGLPAQDGQNLTDLLPTPNGVLVTASGFNGSTIFRLAQGTGAIDVGFGISGAVNDPGIIVGEVRADAAGRIFTLTGSQLGFGVQVYTPDGTPDPVFSGGFVALPPSDGYNALDIGPGGTVTVAGTSQGNLFVVRLLSSGLTDGTFGTGGTATATFPAVVGLPGVQSMVVLPDGATLVGGGDFETQDSFFLARLQGDGVTPTFAVLDPNTGVLAVTGTAGADLINVDLNAPVTFLRAALGTAELFFPVNAVAQLTILAQGGADLVNISPAVFAAALVEAGAGNNTVNGGSGNDTVRGGGGRDSFAGGAGNDLLIAFGGTDSLLGGPGDDTLDTGSGGDFADGNDGNDSLLGGDGADRLDGAPGNDTLVGRAGNDTLLGALGDDVIFGELGDDQIDGSDGNDRLSGGDGNDSLNGALGDDTVDGNAGTDNLIGGDGRDVISGGPGDDRADGGAGADRIAGDDGIDSLIGGGGNDRLNGGIDSDELSGGPGNDTLDAAAGNDRLFGGDGIDMLMGGAGSDTLDGQLGTDFVSGGDGNDLLISDDGSTDTLNGDAGLDIARADFDESFTQVEYFYRFVI